MPPTLVYDAADQRRAPLLTACRDLGRGLAMAPLGGAMGWLDVRQRYSRSVMGPFWVTLSLAIFVLGLAVTYGALFRMPLAEYLPYLTVGMVVWTLLASFLTEGCRCFIDAQAAIKQMPAPLIVHVIRLAWRALIIFGHNALIIAVVVAVSHPVAGLIGLVPALVGLVFVVANGLAGALTLGILSTRFRDIPPLMQNVVQTLFFVTPVLWRAGDLGERAYIATLNPAFHLIEVVRAPLLGAGLPLTSWAVVLGFTAANGLVALLLYSRFRWRVPYWL